MDTTTGLTIGVGTVGGVDEVRIYGKALNLGQVQKLYAEGQKKFESLVLNK
jgi:hypothetical protein